MKHIALLVLFFVPSLVFGAAATTAPKELELSAKVQVGGVTVPLGVVVSTESTDVVLSSTKKDGSTPVTFTLYVSPKPKPVATSSQSAAAVESSAKIQEGIAGFSPAAASTTAPFFTMVDGGRAAISDVIDTQIATTKNAIGPTAGKPGEVLSAEAVKNTPQNPMGTLWFILQTLYLYLLTLLSFIIGSAGVFYPVAALLILYLLWRVIRRAHRPAY